MTENKSTSHFIIYFRVGCIYCFLRFDSFKHGSKIGFGFSISIGFKHLPMSIGLGSRGSVV